MGLTANNDLVTLSANFESLKAKVEAIEIIVYGEKVLELDDSTWENIRTKRTKKVYVSNNLGIFNINQFTEGYVDWKYELYTTQDSVSLYWKCLTNEAALVPCVKII